MALYFIFMIIINVALVVINANNLVDAWDSLAIRVASIIGILGSLIAIILSVAALITM